MTLTRHGARGVEGEGHFYVGGHIAQEGCEEILLLFSRQCLIFLYVIVSLNRDGLGLYSLGLESVTTAKPERGDSTISVEKITIFV